MSTTTTPDTANLSISGESVKLKTLKSTTGWPAIDIKPIQDLEHYTFDPGFSVTAACESSITYINGQKGQLLHRGYPIEKIASRCDYVELVHLLIDGELPDSAQKTKFEAELKEHGHIHDQISKFFNGFRRDAHPMAIMVGVVGALSAFYHTKFDLTQPQSRRHAAISLVSKMPIIAAMSYKYSKGEPFIYPDHDLNYSENFLHMMFDTPYKSKQTKNQKLAEAIDKIFILHADHEQNASTTTVRVAGSTGANPFACISAGISALWGPAHGGANEACLNMLKEIGSKENIPSFIKRAKDPNDPFRLMGFGHRVYKNYDPRARVMRETCHNVLDTVNAQNIPLFELAMELEKIALEDEYFIRKKLYPNVDFYSGITLSAMGIPTNMFTVIFAVARTVGWISHWMEMMADPKRRLYRPRQVYTGPLEKDLPDNY